jgi:predicted amidophosphoribosyltransferase
LQRIRDTPSQTDLDRAQRRRNVQGAFRARSGAPPRIWLVDDVVTTAATLEDAARALREAGASCVVGIVAARTPPPQRGTSYEPPQTPESLREGDRDQRVS